MTLRIHIMAIFVVFLTTRSVSKPILRDTTQSGQQNLVLTRVVEYLRKYGYLEEKKSLSGRRGAGASSSNSAAISSFTIDITDGWEDLLNPSTADVVEFTEEQVKIAIKKFQKFHTLKESGVLDGDTLKWIEAPRCGVKDEVWVPQKKTRSRRKRFTLQGSKWHHSVITYKITTYSRKLTQAETNATIAKAFRKWAEVTPLVFRWSSNADITIRFVEGSHGDGSGFDGKGGELAHGFYPQYGGDIHFDDAEDWTTRDPLSRQKCLLCVAVHEIGHSLGLKHSNVLNSLMQTFYPATGVTADIKLKDDDIKGIQKIYGMCSTAFDAIESWMGNGRTYIFRDDQYWRLNDQKFRADANYPQQLGGSQWQGVPNNIDEMLLWAHNWQAYFFKGSKYYRYDNHADRVIYSRDISQGWPGVPDNIDAAFTHNDWNTYFFKGGLVYQFDNKADRVSAGYPKNISAVFDGLPDNLDTAFRWYYDGKSYFFKGQYFYIWNDSLSRADGPYLSKHFWKNICFV